MKPVIGLIPLYDEEKESYWMLPGYMKILEENVAIPMMHPLTTNKDKLSYFLKICDGFILTGGQDVSPELYNEKPLKNCGTPCYLRDEMEKFILKNSIDIDKSILGICRGIQYINAFLGGSLYQDPPKEYPSKINHMSPPYDKHIHKVKIIKNTLLSEIIKEEIIGVNSYHHQAIKELELLLIL